MAPPSCGVTGMACNAIMLSVRGGASVVLPVHVSGTSTLSVSANLTGLSSSTTYHYRVVGINGAGPPYGLDMTFTTTAGGCTVTPITIGQAVSGSLSTSDCKSTMRG
jgi:hypothetical protein